MTEKVQKKIKTSADSVIQAKESAELKTEELEESAERKLKKL
jgi:hypothetical protein